MDAKRRNQAFEAAKVLRDLSIIYGRPPTIRRMALELGLSPSATYYRIVHASELGLLDYSDALHWSKYYLAPGASERIDDHFKEDHHDHHADQAEEGTGG